MYRAFADGCMNLSSAPAEPHCPAGYEIRVSGGMESCVACDPGKYRGAMSVTKSCSTTTSNNPACEVSFSSLPPQSDLSALTVTVEVARQEPSAVPSSSWSGSYLVSAVKVGGQTVAGWEEKAVASGRCDVMNQIVDAAAAPVGAVSAGGEMVVRIETSGWLASGCGIPNNYYGTQYTKLYARVTVYAETQVCIGCWGGKYSADKNASTCMDCPAGTYSSTDSTQCVACPTQLNALISNDAFTTCYTFLNPFGDCNFYLDFYGFLDRTGSCPGVGHNCMYGGDPPLRLGNKGIKGFRDGVFDNLDACECLYLDGNEITSLPDGLFNGAPYLLYLKLSNNKLVTLPETIFYDFERPTCLGGAAGQNCQKKLIRWLYLDNNELVHLPRELFTPLIGHDTYPCGNCGLFQLHLQGNDALTCIPPGTIYTRSNGFISVIGGSTYYGPTDTCEAS
jgi:Leucine-rich repeat (LRR) protein